MSVPMENCKKMEKKHYLVLQQKTGKQWYVKWFTHKNCNLSVLFWCIDLLCMICITWDITWNSLPSHVFFTCAVTAEIFVWTITFLFISKFGWIESRTQPRPFLEEKWQHFLILPLVLQYLHWKTRYFSLKVLFFINICYFLLRLSKEKLILNYFFLLFHTVQSVLS